MTDAAAYRALIQERLDKKSDAFAAVLSEVSKIRANANTTLSFEIHVAEMTEVFPVVIHMDGPPGTPQLPDEIRSALQGIGKLLSVEEEDCFIVWEDGPWGPQQALEQPIADGWEAAHSLVLPWVVRHASQAGLEAVGCTVVALVHDSASPVIVVPGPVSGPKTQEKPKGYFAALLERKPKGRS